MGGIMTFGGKLLVQMAKPSMILDRGTLATLILLYLMFSKEDWPRLGISS